MTTIDQFGRANVADVHEGGLWHFPSGMPHSLQGVGEDGGEFIIVFDDGKATGFNTLLVPDRVAHTPPEDLALNLGVRAEAFSKIPLPAPSPSISISIRRPSPSSRATSPWLCPFDAIHGTRAPTLRGKGG